MKHYRGTYRYVFNILSKFHVKQIYAIEIIFENIVTTHFLMCKARERSCTKLLR